VVRTLEKPSYGTLPAILLVLVGLVVFANGLTAPFIYDDNESVLTNTSILHIQNPSETFSAPNDTPSAGRPLVNLSLAVNYALGGFSPLGYHVWNLGVHLLNALLLFGIVRRTLEAKTLRPQSARAAVPFAFASALIWTIHPLQTEVVDYVSQRTESMMALFYLLALYCARRAMDAAPNNWQWTAFSVGACASGMACKESMVTAPVMILLYDAVFDSGSVRKALRARWVFYTGLASTWAILIGLVAAAPRGNSAGFSSEITPWIYLLNQPAVILKYLFLAIWPHGLILDYGLPRPMALREVLPAALVVVALLSAAIVAWRRSRPVGFLGAWFFVTLSPTSSFIPIATEVGAERRMYLPLAAVILLIASAVFGAVGRTVQTGGSLWARRFAVGGVAGICGLLAALSIERNAEYRDPVALWQTVVDRRPHGRAHYGLGSELGKRGRLDDATRQFLAATSQSPKAFYALGLLAEQEGRHAEAVNHLREYVRLRPYEVEAIAAYSLMGRALVAEGKVEEAAAAFHQVLVMQPGNAGARNGLAAVHTRLGLGLVARNREREAVEEFAQAVRFEPHDPSKRENLGHALAACGRLEEAAAEYVEALRLFPSKPALHSALGMVLLAQGKDEAALQHLDRALALDPKDERVRTDIAAALSLRPRTYNPRPRP
jgi:Flp pilus assembly protein TadD